MPRKPRQAEGYCAGCKTHTYNLVRMGGRRLCRRCLYHRATDDLMRQWRVI
jgi:hypothetical protein